ncbi:MAG: hypothetical protein FJ087_21510 [Deltaproteobacteria bacterium]|nr:hypothetical protein [Deltaproteobacteria bacterium]
MHPLTPAEIPGFDLLRALQRGLLPHHYLGPGPERSLNAYVQDYLKEEIRDEALTRNLPAFSRFLDAVGYSCGELVNLVSISMDSGVSAKTVREYFQILEDTLVRLQLAPGTTATVLPWQGFIDELWKGAVDAAGGGDR